MKKISLALYVLAFGIIVNSCNDPSTIGSELLQEDKVNVFFTDTLNLSASTVKEDSILGYDADPSVIFDEFIFGDYTDPVFGNVKASIYAQLIMDQVEPDFADVTELDSIVLTLQYDSTDSYGILDADPFSLGVYRVNEPIDRDQNYFSDATFSVDEMMPLAEVLNFTPMLSSNDSIKGLISYSSDADGDTIDIRPSLRIHLPLELGEEILDYTEDVYSSNTNFVGTFNGIHLRPLANTPGAISFNMSTISTSNMTLYFKRDTVKDQYQFEFSNSFVQFNNLEHDVSGTIVEDFFDNTVLGDSLLFLQAMAGPNIKIDIQNTDNLQNIIINKAELEFTVAELAGDDLEDYPPSNLLIATVKNSDDEFVFVRDVVIGSSSFGGVVTDAIDDQGENIQQYTMNISAHFQDIVDGISDGTIFLRAFPKQEQSSRVVVYGPGHSKYPMKLKLTYTKLN